MFGNKKEECLVDEQMRSWIEYAMKWLFDNFGEDFCKEQKVYTSIKELLNDFGLEKASLNDLSNVVAGLMHIEKDDIVVTVYDEGERTLDVGRGRVFIETEEGEQTTAGLYTGKNEDGKYDIGIERKLLKEPINLIATIAHEFSHIKLLGENRIKENDEYLTDLMPIVFGLGVFGACSAFSFKPSYDGWESSTSGYLNQMEWGYALAVYSWLKNNKKPDWVNFLPKNIQSDYKKSIAYMERNEDKIFQQEL
ncbi:MAG: hypothetical protein HRT73_13935 [Flavobacteriales bacterium]|nr:hypothetical protein [Flavobacteriales bacterium]